MLDVYILFLILMFVYDVGAGMMQNKFQTCSDNTSISQLSFANHN